MLKSRNVLDDLITLAVCREPESAGSVAGQASADGGAAASGVADTGFEAASTALTRPFAPVGAWGVFATWAFTPLAPPTSAVAFGPAVQNAFAESAAPLAAAEVMVGTARHTGDADLAAAPSPTAGAKTWSAPDTAPGLFDTQSAYPDKSGFNKKALATTQPQVIDFTSGPQGVFGSDTSFTFSLPSFLYQHYEFGIGASFAGFGLNASASITGGIKGSVALTLGQFTPNYPVTIDPGVAPFVQDGQVFSIDPTLVSTDDAQFSLSLPQANASLDFGLQAKAGVALTFPSLRIGVTLPFVGFVGYTIHIPSQTVGFSAGNIYKLPSNSTISIPGDGTVTLSELQAKLVNSTPQSAYGSLPTLEMSGNTDPFFVANTDLVSILAQEVPDPFAALQGDESFYGLAGLSYKLLSLPLSGALWLNEDVTLTPIGINETVTDTLTGQQQSGPLGTSFNFTAPSSGSGIIPLTVTFGLDLQVHTTLELDGDIKLTLEGPSVSASILGLSGGIGPLGNFNLLDISGALFQLYSNTFDETLTSTTTVDVQTFVSPVTKKVSGKSGPVSLTKPGTDLLVTASGTVTGGVYGVQTGTLSAAVVTDYGLITATGNGVDLQEGGTVDVESGGRITASGAAPGAGALVMGNTVDAVVNAGAITGFSQGVNMIGGSLKNETGGRITATSVGVSIANPDATIINNGYIHASTAVALNQGGGLYNALSGVISGATYGFYTQGVTSGIYITGAVAVENQCTITGGVAGVRALAGGGVTNLDGAYIHGGGTGVALSGDFRSTVTVTNGVGATISGGAVGVSLVGDYATLVDYGTISGSQVAVEMYGASTDTVVLGPDARLLGGIRFSPGFTNIRLEAGNGDVGALDLAGLSLVEQGHTFEFSGGITIAGGAAWDISGDFLNAVVSGLNASDQLDDTAIAYSVGERAVVNAFTDVLSIRAAGNPTVSLGTIHLTGTLNYAPIVTEGASGGVDISFSSQKLTTVSANNGEVYIAPSGFFGAEVTIAAGVLVSSNYYGYRAQSYAVLAAHERATLTNYGTVTGNGGGVVLRGGGLVVNEAGATISGSVGVDLRAISPDPTDTVSLTNAGVISAVGNGVYINTPGTVTNTGLISSSALNGVQFNYDVSGSVFNQGTITGGRSGVRMFDGGTVYNGASGLLATHAAYFFGVEISGAYGKLINLGTISSTGSAGVGVYLSDGGLVVNESGAITGKADGVKIAGAAGNIANAAYISGIRLSNGGTIINSASGTIGAAGGYGVSFYNHAGPFAAYLHNLGRIDGVLAFGNDTIVNDGTIDGVGVVAGSAGGVTIVNTGVIQGSGGVAVKFTASSDQLIADAGSRFTGAVQGGGGGLELAGIGSGTISGLGGAAQLSGAISASFSGFGRYLFDSGMSLTLTGSAIIAQGKTLTDNGPLTIGAGTTLDAYGLVAIGGSLNLGGAIVGLPGASAPGGAGGLGVDLLAGGAITLSGSIRGGDGLNDASTGYQGDAGGAGVAGPSAGTITINSGLIAGGAGGSNDYYQGGGGAGGAGVSLGSGVVTNNGGTIAGGAGGRGDRYYDVGGPGGAGGVGVSLAGAGTVTNAGGAIFGGAGGAGGTGGYYGGAGGAGGAGVILAGGGVVINASGTISGGGGGAGGGGYHPGSAGQAGNGVWLAAGGMVVNGSSTAPTALISGATGVYVGAGRTATVINFGTIRGTGGTAVQFGSSSDRLIAEAGSTWLGVVIGGGGALELAGGTGTITGLGGGAATLSGAEAMTTSGFGAYVIDAGGTWTLAGAHTLAAGQTLTNAGTLTGALALGAASDRLIIASGSIVNGAVSGGGGVLELAGTGGTISGLGRTGTLSGAASMTFSGFGSYAIDAGGSWTLAGAQTLSANKTLTNAGTLSGSLTLGAASDRLIVASGSIVSGTVNGGNGVLELTGAGGTITGLGSIGTLSGGASMVFRSFGAYLIDAGGSWTLIGSNPLSGAMTLTVAGSLTNRGTLTGNAGIRLSSGGTVDNAAGAAIFGYVGVYAGPGGAATVTNYGTINGGGGTAVQFASTGDRLVAEAGSHFSGAAKGGGGTLELASGAGYITGLGSSGKLTGAEVLNFSGFGAYAIDAGASWTLQTTNTLGSSQTLAVAGALINSGTLIASGAAGVDVLAGGAFTNKGAISGLAAAGVDLTAAGTIDNASGGAVISGEIGVYAGAGSAATVTNFGTIAGVSGVAVKFASVSDRLIVEAGASFAGSVQGGGGTLEMASVTGTLTGLGGDFAGFETYAVDAGGAWTLSGSNALAAAGTVSVAGALGLAGSLSSAGAIAGGAGAVGGYGQQGGAGVIALALSSGSASLNNTGLIAGGQGGAGGQGAYAGTGGTGAAGVRIATAGASIGNGGSITGGAGGVGGYSANIGGGGGGAGGVGVWLAAAGALTNTGAITGGAGGVAPATPVYSGHGGQGGAGSSISTAGLITNNGGTISGGAGGDATFGGIYGGGGGFGGAGVALSGGTLANVSGAVMGGAAGLPGGSPGGGHGPAGIAGDGVLLSAGVVIDGSSTSNIALIEGMVGVYAGAGGAATVTSFGTIDGTGGTSVQFKSAGDRLIAESGSTWIGAVQGGGGTLELAGGTGTITGLGGVGTLSGAEAMTFSGFGSYAVDTGSSWTVSGGSILANHILTIADKASLTVQGAITNSGKIALAAKTHTTSLIIGAAGATLSGHGAVAMGANAMNTVIGALGTATLTNVDNTIAGAGQIGAGKLVLINDAAGLIEQAGSLALTINTGAKTIINQGTIEATGSGGAVIASAVTNTGLLEAVKGNLTVNGAVTGTGAAFINAGTLNVTSSFSQNVTFGGTSGQLELANSQSYMGTITGFSTSGGTSFDLRDIGFVSGSEATFSGTKTGGILSVTDGMHTATIALTGNYTKSTWTASSDGHNGVIVVDTNGPPMTPPGAPSAPVFIAAMAGMGAGSGEGWPRETPLWRDSTHLLVAAHTRLY